MLFELDNVADFIRLNPRDHDIDEEYIRELLDDHENNQNEMSFIQELDEYEEIIQHENPDIVRLSEILNDLIEYVLDTDAAYVMFRVILKVFNERFSRDNTAKQEKLKPLDEGTQQEISSSEDSYAMRFEIESHPGAAASRNNPKILQNLTETFGEIN